MNLLNAVRDTPELPDLLRKGQPCTWWTHVINVAAVIGQRTRRVQVKLAGHSPWWNLYHTTAHRLIQLIPSG